VRVPCWAGIAAGFEFQLSFAIWLCDANIRAADVTPAGLSALCASDHARNWLWDFLDSSVDKRALLDDARQIADLVVAQKQSLLSWVKVVKDVGAQFSELCEPWPAPPRDNVGWIPFERLMCAFYSKWQSKGLPFDAVGNAVAKDGVTYAQFVTDFKDAHGNRTCVFCGGPLGTPQVDHWIPKTSFPLFAIAPENLIPICNECNRPGVKGSKATYQLAAAFAFADWFHPYFRPGFGKFEIRYADPETDLRVCMEAKAVEDVPRVERLNGLLSLHDRWTSEFKAMYGELQKKLRQLVQAGRIAPHADDLREEIKDEISKLLKEEIHYELRSLLLNSALDPARLEALATQCRS
jgi:hypothetical protein